MTKPPSTTTEVVSWKDGEKNRKLAIFQPCSCASCRSANPEGLPYLSWSNGRGQGFTVYLPQKVAKSLEKFLPKEKAAP